MWVFYAGVGAVLAGAYYVLRNLLPYLAAQRSGVIARQGARNVRVRRDEDPLGFRRLLANRGKGIAFGVAVSAAGLAVLGLLALNWIYR